MVIHKANGGVSAARNEALKIVTGDYLTFCDSDDFLEKDWLEVLYSVIKESNVDCVNAGYKCVDEVKLDSVNEISVWAGKSFFPLAKSKKEKKWFSIIHFLTMNCQYYKIINGDKYPFLAKEIILKTYLHVIQK